MKPRFRVKAQGRPCLALVPDNVVPLPVVTKLDLEPFRVLSAAINAGVTDVIVIGYDPHGEEWFASSLADGGEVLWQLERAKKRLLSVVEDIRNGVA